MTDQIDEGCVCEGSMKEERLLGILEAEVKRRKQ